MDVLLDRVLADPQDLGARMVYGDALVEANDPRGELVIAQCTLASAGIDRVADLVDAEIPEAELARLAGIQRRVQQLVARHQRKWLAPLELPDGAWVRFRRGMPESITIRKGEPAVPLLERLVKLTPIGELELRSQNAQTLREIGAMPLVGLRALDLTIGGALPWDTYAGLIRPTLHHLRIAWARLEVAEVDRIAQLPLPGLRTIDLSGNWRLGADPIVRLLAAHPDVVVTLRNCKLDDTQLRALLAGAPNIRGLDVRDNPLSVGVLRELVALPRLRWLGFDPGREVKHDKATVGRAVAKATAPLRSLALGGSVNGPGLAAIAASELDVRAIDLTNDRPGDIGAAGNAALTSMKRLVMLDVRWESQKIGLALAKLPTLAHFDCGGIESRTLQKRLLAHFGDCIPAYEEREPTFRRTALQRRVEIPDDTLAAIDVAPTLRKLRGLDVEIKVSEWLVRDPKVIADPIGVSFKKLPGKPRYLTLWYWPEDADAWAARLDEIASFVVRQCGGRDVDASPKQKAKTKPKPKAKAKAKAKAAKPKR